MKFALHYWARQSRRASFRLLFVSVVLAVSAIASVGVFSARLEAALVRDATQLLGGDLVVETKRQPAQDTAWKLLADQPEFRDLSRAQSAVFPSVIPSEKTDLLVSVKAVSDSYPLRGSLLVRQRGGAEVRLLEGPESGHVWVDQGVLGSLGIQLGDTIQVGELPMVVSNVILIEPDRGGGFVNFAPRIMISLDDLQLTGLIGMGSRVRWNNYFAGPTPVVDAYKAQVTPLLSPTDELETIEEGRPEMSRTMDRAQDFLAMSALIGTLVACVGMGLVSHLFAREQSRELGILKSLGFTPGQLICIWLTGLFLLTLAAGSTGVGLGWLAHWGLLALLSGLIGFDLPMAGLAYLPSGMLLAASLLVGFCALPAWFALRAPTVAVIRNQKLRSKGLELFLSIGMGVLCTLGICLVIVKNTKLGLLLFVGFVAVSVVFGLLFWSVLKFFALLEKGVSRWGSRIAVFQSMSKRSGMLVVQGVSLSLGLAALLILAVVQGDLIDRWRDAVPDDAPNRFVFNIQPDQVDSVSSLVSQYLTDDLSLYPMVRGRLAAINGSELNANSYQNDRAQRLVQREFNISFTEEVPPYNEVVQGKWFEPDSNNPQVSLESSVADRLGINLGDKLTFDFAGARLTATVSSIRDLRWDSMQVNFYIIFPPKVLSDFPQTWITAFYAPEPGVLELSRNLVRDFPNVTVLDTARLIEQIRGVLTQVGKAVQFIFLFTVAAGGLVVIACVLTGSRARMRESSIYRAMGASSSQLARAAWIELSVLGLVAGLVATAAAQILAWAVSQFVFEFEYVLSPTQFLLGLAIGGVVSVVFGAWSLKKVCLAPVMHTLRQAAE